MSYDVFKERVKGLVNRSGSAVRFSHMERYDFILDRGLEVGGMYEFRHVNGHIEVFLDGEFQFSADTMQEAYCELKAG